MQTDTELLLSARRVRCPSGRARSVRQSLLLLLQPPSSLFRRSLALAAGWTIHGFAQEMSVFLHQCRRGGSQRARLQSLLPGRCSCQYFLTRKDPGDGAPRFEPNPRFAACKYFPFDCDKEALKLISASLFISISLSLSSLPPSIRLLGTLSLRRTACAKFK